MSEAKWIRLADQLPPDRTNVLVTDGTEIASAHFSYPDWMKGNDPPWYFGCCGFGGWDWEWEVDMKSPHLAWMPIPALPSQE